MVLRVPVEDPGLCELAAEWDSVTMETVKQRYLWTTGENGPAVNQGKGRFSRLYPNLLWQIYIVLFLFFK